VCGRWRCLDQSKVKAGGEEVRFALGANAHLSRKVRGEDGAPDLVAVGPAKTWYPVLGLSVRRCGRGVRRGGRVFSCG
jgi:hypothetical protein